MALNNTYRRKFIQKFFRTNLNITAPQVRLIGADGKQIGLVTRQEALNKAQEVELDLVEIASTAKPPVCRIIDYKKFKYELERKERENKKNNKNVGQKEIQMGPFSAEGDVNVRLNRAKEYLADGHSIKIVVKFSGRQMTHPEFGKNQLKNFVDKLAEISKVDRDAHFEGRNFVSTIIPITKKDLEVKK